MGSTLSAVVVILLSALWAEGTSAISLPGGVPFKQVKSCIIKVTSEASGTPIQHNGGFATRALVPALESGVEVRFAAPREMGGVGNRFIEGTVVSPSRDGVVEIEFWNGRTSDKVFVPAHEVVLDVRSGDVAWYGKGADAKLARVVWTRPRRAGASNANAKANIRYWDGDRFVEKEVLKRDLDFEERALPKFDMKEPVRIQLKDGRVTEAIVNSVDDKGFATVTWKKRGVSKKQTEVVPLEELMDHYHEYDEVWVTVDGTRQLARIHSTSPKKGLMKVSVVREGKPALYDIPYLEATLHRPPRVKHVGKRKKVQVEGRAVVNAEHMGSNPDRHLEQLEALGMEFRNTVLLKSGTYTLTDPIQFGNRQFAFGIVETKEGKFFRTFWKDPRDGVIRAMPSTFDERLQVLVGKPKYEANGRGRNLDAPIELEFGWNEMERLRGVKEVDPKVMEQLVQDSVPYNFSQGDFDAYVMSRDYHQRQAFYLPHTLRTPTGIKLEANPRARGLLPSEIDFKAEAIRPNYKKLVDSYRTNLAGSGEVQALVYASNDGKVHYVRYVDLEGRSWLSRAEYIDLSITRHGINPADLDLGRLGARLWEVEQRISPGKVGEAHPDFPRLRLNWESISQMPDTKRFYEDSGFDWPVRPKRN